MSQFINRNTLRSKVVENIKLPWTWEAKFRRLADYIKGMPGEEVAPVVHGRWESARGGYYCCCSACRAEAISYEGHYGDKEYRYTKFCSNCGAKMDACAGKCEYAQMMERKHGKVLTPENCGLHRDKMCPELD